MTRNSTKGTSRVESYRGERDPSGSPGKNVAGRGFREPILSAGVFLEKGKKMNKVLPFIIYAFGSLLFLIGSIICIIRGLKQ